MRIEPLHGVGDEQPGETGSAPPLTMDLKHSPHAKRVRARVVDVIREGDVGGVALAATTASVHVLRIDPFGRITFAVDVADSISIACYLADPSCIQRAPSTWQQQAA